MNTIQNYLEAMFRRLPNTPEIIRAKCELGQMMEDKYSELIAEGATENEAVGQVISEFGNLDELADALGIRDILSREKAAASSRRMITAQESTEYLADKETSGLLHGFGTFFAIICSCAVILYGCAGAGSLGSLALSLLFLFGSIAACIGLHVYASFHMNRWDFLKNENCGIDYGTAAMVNELRQKDNEKTAREKTAAALLFITCYIPLVLLCLIPGGNSSLLAGVGVDILLVMVGLGVVLLTDSGARTSGFRLLLNLNVSSYAPHANPSENKDDAGYVYSNKIVAAILSVYWPTVTCIYLIISFLTFTWAISWIIWPIAACIQVILRSLFGKKGDN